MRSIPQLAGTQRVWVAVILMTMSISCSTSRAGTDSFVYAGCSPKKYSAGSQYESSLNSLLNSLLSSASYSSSTNLTAGSVHGLFQCRLDLPTPADCSSCVSACVAQLRAVCPASAAATLRLDGCFLKYDSAAFMGVEDKTLVVRNCGSQQLGQDQLGRRDSVLGYVATATAQAFRAGGEGDVHAVAECVGGLSPAQCQDCLGEAIARLKTDCSMASWGDVYLSSCYARYAFTASPTAAASTQNGSTNKGATNDGQTQKNLAIIIGIIALVGLIVICAAFLRKHCKDECGK